MAIELYFSNQLDLLAEKMSENISTENRAKANLLDPAVVIVPNANLSKWLQLMLAQRESICMNIDFQYLESGLWNMLSELDSHPKRSQILDNNLLKLFVLYGLQNLDANDSDLAPLRHYLMDAGGNQRPDYCARMWQLSEKLAQLFQEYEFHRTDMIRKWQAGAAAKHPAERCQQRVYLSINMLMNDYFFRTGERLLSITRYAEKILSAHPTGEPRGEDNRRIHFFGLSQISDFHLTLIGRLQHCFDILIYSLNPSREFWEDIKTPLEKRWLKRKKVETFEIRSAERDQGELFRQDDNALLAAWGKPGRESIRLLCQLTDYEFNACYGVERPERGILQRVQNDILTLATTTDSNDELGQDRSLQIFACPSLYREVETVFNSILFNLEENKDLQLTDIAILTPSISTYKPVIDSVFNRKPRCLAYNLVDSKAEIESVYGQAIVGILSLAAGRFSRREVFGLILNPCFMNRWGIDLDNVRAWAGWVEQLHIFHTYDRHTTAVQGSPDSGAYSWKQGFQRLRLSRIMADPHRGNLGKLGHFQQLVPFNDVKTADVDLMERFCLVIETLHSAVSILTSARATGQEWKEMFLNVCDRLVEIPRDLKGESSVRQTLVQAFETLKLYDRIQGDGPESKLDIALIKEFVCANLKSISGGHGDYLTGGITVSALLPMRPIPFKVVYVLGMEEGNFPGKADLTSLDLRLLQRRIGDISLPERNCYLFLEMLLSVQDKLYISYIFRDLQKDRTRQPCSVINQLRRYVEQEIFSDGRRFQISEIPLNGSSRRYLAPEAINSSSDILVNYSLAQRLIYYRSKYIWEHFSQTASEDDLNRIRSFIPDFSIDFTQSEKIDELRGKITARQLKKFLEDPARQSMRRHLGLSDETDTIEDLVFDEDEPFYSEFPLDYRLKMETLNRWLDSFFSAVDCGNQAPSPEKIYNPVYDEFRRKSQTPEGAYAELDRHDLRANISGMIDTLWPVLEQMRSARRLYRTVVVGESIDIPAGSSLDHRHFEIVSSIITTRTYKSDTVRYDIGFHGQLPWVWQDSDDCWHTLIVTGSGKKPAQPDKYVLEPVIFYLICLTGKESCKWIGTSGITLHLLYQEQVMEVRYRFDQETAGIYLADLASDFMDQTDRFWLPFETITTRLIKPHKLEEDKINDRVRQAFAGELEDALGEVDDLLTRITRPKIPEDAFDITRRRIKLFFDFIDCRIS